MHGVLLRTLAGAPSLGSLTLQARKGMASFGLLPNKKAPCCVAVKSQPHGAEPGKSSSTCTPQQQQGQYQQQGQRQQ